MMPLLGGNDESMQTHKIGGSNFSFQGARIDDLGATEYTLVDIAVDVTGSVEMFADDLHKMLVVAVKSCKSSPRSDNLLVRVTTFSTAVGGVRELHGYKPFSEIDPDNDYPQFHPGGATPLYDAVYSCVGANVEYGSKLVESDYDCNGIAFIITDGMEGDWTGEAVSASTPAMIAGRVKEARQGEKLESLVTVLIGINAEEHHSKLEAFQREAGLDQYIDAGEVTKGKLAKLADFVSQSVSSQSQALGTGGPSQDISASI